jgi:tripartite-type tricarboxylate transporter receptor subunit TctC
MIDRRQFTLSSTALFALGAAGQALAQSLETARVLCGFPAGGTTDAVSRRVADKLRGSFAKTALVENKPGAGGRLAVEELKRSANDGSTMLLTPAAMITLYPHIYTKLAYGIEDVTPVCTAGQIGFGFGVGPGVPESVKTLKDFLAWAKANPNQASYGSPGAGSMPHLLGALLGLRAGVELKHVPYRGTVPSITDLVGGQIAAAMNPSGDYLQYMKTGRVRVLATSGRKRSPYLPDVPTFTELGYPDVTSEEWFGFYAPAKTPAATIAAANAAITAALKDKSVIDALALVGLVANGSTPQEMAADQKAEYERWGPLVKQIGFTAES